MKRFMKPSKVLLCTLCVGAAALCAAGCSAKEVRFYMGTSANAAENTELALDKTVTIAQDKEKIEDGELVFYKNESKSYDDINLCFSGGNIKSVTAASDNKTVLYANYENLTRLVDMVEFYYYPDGDINPDEFAAEADFCNKWDNFWGDEQGSGELDHIKYVYFNGVSSTELSKNSYSVNAVFYDEENLKDAETSFYYLDEEQRVTDPVVVVNFLCGKAASEYGYKSESFGNPDSYVTLGSAVTANENTNEDYFIYRYEKLFYNALQSASGDEAGFDYGDLTGETLSLNVEYEDGTSEAYKLVISFDDSGNILAKLSQG